MDGYRYWVERHKLLIALANDKERLLERATDERTADTIALETDFRDRLDVLYGEARTEFESPRAKN